MGWFTPKYPQSDTPDATGTPPTRRERRAARQQPVDHSTIGEAELREYERRGWSVERRSGHVLVERTDDNGGSAMRSFSVLGNGRFGKR
ncbi:hypothetical protein [Streptomyces sp. 351MFTsu5.1]|uniref:hypothetical protein n=1 Tax=Streptomyces sp. 351MFTsu5.1 TaxID=1172180 RepID=UPI00037DBCB6|nr:hypothetical protein [Streptomyces sp. 351MFTsu5.1]